MHHYLRKAIIALIFNVVYKLVPQVIYITPLRGLLGMPSSLQFQSFVLLFNIFAEISFVLFLYFGLKYLKEEKN